jgi:hypothetical protein
MKRTHLIRSKAGGQTAESERTKSSLVRFTRVSEYIANPISTPVCICMKLRLNYSYKTE